MAFCSFQVFFFFFKYSSLNSKCAYVLSCCDYKKWQITVFKFFMSFLFLVRHNWVIFPINTFLTRMAIGMQRIHFLSKAVSEHVYTHQHVWNMFNGSVNHPIFGLLNIKDLVSIRNTWRWPLIQPRTPNISSEVWIKFFAVWVLDVCSYHSVTCSHFWVWTFPEAVKFTAKKSTLMFT